MAHIINDNLDNVFCSLADYIDVESSIKVVDPVYNQQFRELCTNIFATIIANKYKGKPIEEIQDSINCEMENYLSWYLLRESYCMVYPLIRYQVARKNYQCFLSRNDIWKGSCYYRYMPLIIATDHPDNPKTYKKYKLSEIIICHEVMEDSLPTNINGLDNMAYHANYALLDDNSTIDYEHFSHVLGSQLSLIPIKK